MARSIRIPEIADLVTVFAGSWKTRGRVLHLHFGVSEIPQVDVLVHGVVLRAVAYGAGLAYWLPLTDEES